VAHDGVMGHTNDLAVALDKAEICTKMNKASRALLNM
jgi:hypothetical protein